MHEHCLLTQVSVNAWFSALRDRIQSDADTDVLRDLYTQACRQCFPNIVLDEVRGACATYFASINHAYLTNDTETLESIAGTLQKMPGSVVKSNCLTSIDQLEHWVTHLQSDISHVCGKVSSQLEQAGEKWEAIKSTSDSRQFDKRIAIRAAIKALERRSKGINLSERTKTRKDPD